jgi:hypothetical protein
VRLLVTAGNPQSVHETVAGLADWLSAPPVVYSHLPIGRVAGETPAVIPSLLQVSPPSLRLLACQQSPDGEAVILRLQETVGVSVPASLQFAGMTAPATLVFKPYELKTMRLERSGACIELNQFTETFSP